MVFKGLMNISIYKILLNKFKIKDLSKPLQPNLEAPINHLFKDLNFNYETDSTSSTLYRFNSWFTHVILLVFFVKHPKTLDLHFLSLKW